jgi:hypothetical protein
MRFACLCVLLSAAAAGTAAAENVDSLVKTGIELRRVGRDREALEQFEKAAQIQGSPRLTAQIGTAEQALGLWVKAEAHIKEALAEAHDLWIQKNRPARQEALKVVQDHIGDVDVWGEPAGAEVLFEERVVGTLPLPHAAHLAEGDVVLRVRAKGYADVTRTIKVQGGNYSREHVELRPIAVAAAPPPVVTAPLQPVAPPPPARPLTLVTQPAGEPVAASPPVYRRWWFWTMGGRGRSGWCDRRRAAEPPRHQRSRL